MKKKKKEARIAGLLYLLLAISGAFGILYFPEQILVASDPAATAENVRNAGMRYEWSIIAQFISQVTFLFLALAFYRLFKGVQDFWSKSLVALVVAAVPIALLNTVHLLAARALATGTLELENLNQTQLDGLAFLLLQIYEWGVVVAEIFWGLWLIPLGLLSIKSGYIPRLIGIFLLLGGAAYLVEVSLSVLNPALLAAISTPLTVVLSVGELSMVLWLVIKGVK